MLLLLHVYIGFSLGSLDKLRVMYTVLIYQITAYFHNGQKGVQAGAILYF